MSKPYYQSRLGGACVLVSPLPSFAGYALSGWLIDYIVRAFPDMLLSGPLLDQLPEHGVGRLLIVLGLINGILYTAGIWIGGVLADRWGAKNKAAYALVPAFGLILAIPFLIAIFWLKSLGLLLGAMAIYLVLTGFYLGPSFAIAQTLAPVKVRATSTALFFFVLNMIAPWWRANIHWYPEQKTDRDPW